MLNTKRVTPGKNVYLTLAAMPEIRDKASGKSAYCDPMFKKVDVTILPDSEVFLFFFCALL